MHILLACREWDAYVRSVELPAGIAKGISAEARRRPLTMTLNLVGTAIEVRRPFPSRLPDPERTFSIVLQGPCEGLTGTLSGRRDADARHSLQ